MDKITSCSAGILITSQQGTSIEFALEQLKKKTQIKL